MKKKKYKYIIIVIIIIFIIIITYLINKKNNNNNINNNYSNKVTKLKEIEDPTVRDIYYQFNLEQGILYNTLGSSKNKKLYGYYYKKNKIKYKDLSNTVKSYLTLHSYDYKNSITINKEKECYEVDLENLKITYGKIFGDNNDFKFSYSKEIEPTIKVENNIACIYDNQFNNYKYTIDTNYLSHSIKKNKLTILESVAFIKVNKKYYEFYSDYEMKHLVYSLYKKTGNISFLNNTNIVSNILLKNKNKFPVYKYTFEKNNDHYIFKSIELVKSKKGV